MLHIVGHLIGLFLRAVSVMSPVRLIHGWNKLTFLLCVVSNSSVAKLVWQHTSLCTLRMLYCWFQAENYIFPSSYVCCLLLWSISIYCFYFFFVLMVGTAQAVHCTNMDSESSSGPFNISVTCLYNLLLMVLDILGEFLIQASNIPLRLYNFFFFVR